jgi:hypothetical protein
MGVSSKKRKKKSFPGFLVLASRVFLTLVVFDLQSTYHPIIIEKKQRKSSCLLLKEHRRFGLILVALLSYYQHCDFSCQKSTKNSNNAGVLFFKTKTT